MTTYYKSVLVTQIAEHAKLACTTGVSEATSSVTFGQVSQRRAISIWLICVSPVPTCLNISGGTPTHLVINVYYIVFIPIKTVRSAVWLLIVIY